MGNIYTGSNSGKAGLEVSDIADGGSVDAFGITKIKNPDYLKGTALGPNPGYLGWMCKLKGPNRERLNLRHFLNNPSNTVEFTFVNKKYAERFARENNAEIVNTIERKK